MSTYNSILKELKAIVTSANIPVETGVFSDEPPNTYIVITPLNDIYEFYADNLPQNEIQEARLSIFTKKSYLDTKAKLIVFLLANDFVITDRRFLGYEDETKYYHFVIDVSKQYKAII